MEERSPEGIGYLLERTTRMVKLNYSKAFKTEGFDITPEQWVLLERLFLQGGQTQNDLASGSFKDAPTVSRILHNLQKKGYINKESGSSDRRVRRVDLSPAGHELVKRMQPTVAKLRQQGWRHLSDEDYRHFVRIIDCIFENYDLEDSLD